MSAAGTNWAGNLTYSAERLLQPRTVEELQDVVAGSRGIRALGSRHSFNDVADSTRDLVNLDLLAGEVIIDTVARAATFPAGMRYGDLSVQLEKQGWALANLASLPHISVAGAVATATHGSGDHNPALSSAVLALQLVTADGTLLELDRLHAQFAGAVVAVGMLGVLSSLTVEIEPSFTMRQDVYQGLAWSDLIERFDEVSGSGYSVSVNPDFTDTVGSRVRVKSRSSDVPDAILGAKRVERELDLPAGASDRSGAPGLWLDLLPHFLPGFRPSFGDELQSEYLMDRRHAGAALEALRPLADQFLPVLHGAEVRTMCSDDLWLSPAYGRDTVGIHFTWKLPQELVIPLLPLIEAALAPFDPRPHWGKLFHSLDARYPRMEDFIALRASLDPTGKFSNAFVKRTFPG